MSKSVLTKAIILILFLVISCKKYQLPLKNEFTDVNLENSNLPDFSYVGYKKLESPIPNVPVFITLEPEEEDNYSQIQGAIDSISELPLKNGIRGAILLKKGIYDINKSLSINSSGIVIRGEGQGVGGTEIISQVKHKVNKSVKELQSEAVINIFGNEENTQEIGKKFEILNDVDALYSNEIQVENPRYFNIGDTISVTKTPNYNWINLIQMKTYGWTPEYFKVSHIRTITGLKNDKLVIDIPLFDSFIRINGGGYVTKMHTYKKLENSGVENLRISTVYENDEDEKHIWNAVLLSNVTNCWVKNITATNFSFSAVSIHNSNYNIVQDCIIRDFKSKPIGDRRYGFYISSGSMGNLIQRCYTSEARHDFVTGSRVPGPNVFLDCIGVNSLSHTGPHHRWATGTLYDNVKSSYLYAINANSRGSGHGWTGAYNMFWNNQAINGFKIESPPGAVNWVIGGIGGLQAASKAYNASHGIRVRPRSIFLEQVRARLGESSVNMITKPSQRQDKPVWDEIKTWAETEAW